MIPDPIKRKIIVEKIKKYISQHNTKYPGKLIFMRIDWSENNILLFYQNCCGGIAENEHYTIAEKNLYNIYPCEVIWYRRQ